MEFMNLLELMIYGGMLIGDLLLLSVLIDLSLGVIILSLFMDMKDVVMDPWMSDTLKTVLVSLLLTISLLFKKLI